MTLHATTVADCYRIARREARAFQRLANKCRRPKDYVMRTACLAARDAADRIANKIRYGTDRSSRERST